MSLTLNYRNRPDFVSSHSLIYIKCWLLLCSISMRLYFVAPNSIAARKQGANLQRLETESPVPRQLSTATAVSCPPATFYLGLKYESVDSRDSLGCFMWDGLISVGIFGMHCKCVGKMGLAAFNGVNISVKIIY